MRISDLLARLGVAGIVLSKSMQVCACAECLQHAASSCREIALKYNELARELEKAAAGDARRRVEIQLLEKMMEGNDADSD